MRDDRLRYAAGLVLLTALALGLLLWNIGAGSVDITLGEIAGSIRAMSGIIWAIRLPRVAAAAILGGALSVSGFLLQTFFANPIAGPFVLGISSGAKMVVSFTIIFAARFVSQVSSALMVLSAFAGSLVITGVVLLFSQRARNMSMLLVIGIMVGYICSAVTDFFITFAKEQDIVNLTSWSMGSFSGANWSGVGATAALCLGGLAAAAVLYALFRPGGAGAWAVVSVEGEETARYPLSEDRTVTLGDGRDWNLLRIAGGRVAVTEASCGDLTCVDTGPIWRAGETIVCLPHRLMVSIEGGAASPFDAATQ